MINLENYGLTPELIPENQAGSIARVTAVHKERYELVCEFGEIFGRLKASVYYGDSWEDFPTTGDFVMVDFNPSGDSRIIKTLPRKTKFSRNNFLGHAAGYVKTIKEQLVAANFDYVFILQSLNHDLSSRRLERYLSLAWQSGAKPVVVLTKEDIGIYCEEQFRTLEKLAIGCQVHNISAKTGYGLEALSLYLKPGKTIVFLGSSGVGKSSLVNALAGEEIMAVKEIREGDSRGRHTTTHRQLIMLPRGTAIIDTPDMRELGMWDANEGLGEAFADIEEYMGKCKFSDCRHQSEPGCAIIAAIESGELPKERWDSYNKIKKETKFVEEKSVLLKNRDVRNKDLAIKSRKRKLEGKNK